MTTENKDSNIASIHVNAMIVFVTLTLCFAFMSTARRVLKKSTDLPAVVFSNWTKQVIFKTIDFYLHKIISKIQEKGAYLFDWYVFFI